MTIDTTKPVRVRRTPGNAYVRQFTGLIGLVEKVTDTGAYAVFWPKRGATSVWFEHELENVPEGPATPKLPATSKVRCHEQAARLRLIAGTYAAISADDHAALHLAAQTLEALS